MHQFSDDRSRHTPAFFFSLSLWLAGWKSAYFIISIAVLAVVKLSWLYPLVFELKN